MPVKGEASKPAARRKYAASKEMSYRQAVISLAIGDILVFLIFVIIGDSTHGKLSGLAAILHIILDALPFIAGWFIVSPFTGIFRRDLFTQPLPMAIRTAVAWIPACATAMIVRVIS